MAEKLTRAQEIERLKNRLARLETRETEAQRKADARKKIVVGGAILGEMKDDPALHDQVVEILKRRVTRPADQKAVAEWLSIGSQPGQ